MNEAAPIRVLVADDHPVVREGLCSLINRTPEMTVIGEASTWTEALERLAELHPDVSLCDVRMPGTDAARALATLREQAPEARVILLTAYDGDEEIFQGLRAGAKGFLLKDMPREELVEAIRTVHRGETCIPPAVAAKLARRLSEPELSAREMDVLKLLAQGKGNRDIATALNVSDATIKAHVNHILRKLNAKGRAEAIVVAARRGFVRLQ